TQISIGANQLEDADGNEPTGDVTLSMYTYDLTQEEMVGDMSGINDEGQEVAMESAGAFYASFEDEAGNELNVKDGETVEVSVPAVEERPNEVLTVWSYDPETGLWVEEGVATLEDGRYVAEVSHFSYWNFDWEKRTPSCIKLTVEPGYLAANTPLNVRAILQTNPVTVRDLVITQATNVLINLPNNTDVKFYRSPDYTNPIDTVTSGAAWGGVGTPAHPYDVCNGQVVIQDAPAPAAATLQGLVTDAVSGNPIANAQVCLQGTSQCVATDANGNYTISDAPAGNQVLNITADGFIAVNDQAVTITAGETTTQPVALSPELAVGELRIVLTWGDKPSDLDSYLDLPSGNQISHNVKGQLIDGAILDLDDVDGHGPETITISQLNAGTYTYAIYNYGRGNLGEATTIPASGAVVRVYRGDQEIATYTAESLAGDGNTWNVFTPGWDNWQHHPVNTLSQ
ncbi:MAG: carboxypeptidase regulatory-like domain-containing protein, partial [Chloroflexota bacterium]